VGDLLASLGKGEAEHLPTTADGGRCPACGATLQDFRESGRLGCPQCYSTFAAPLRTLLRRIHGASRHIGEPYAPPVTGAGDAVPDDLESLAAVRALREQLQRAVDAENFELAARLRDEIRERE